MGAVGGLLGLGGGAGGTGFSTPSGTNPGQLQNSYDANQKAMQQQQALLSAIQGQNGLQNQSNVYNQLQGVVAGQGPNPAQAMLNQSTGANVANQAALMAGQRGASANPGLMARQAAQQGANIQQQAAGQGASMQAQQSLGALGQAGQMAGNMTANQIGQTNANASSQQNEQNILQGANTSNNAVQGQLANTTMQGQQGLIGGAMNALGGLFHEGGQVQKMAEGGVFGPQSMFGQFISQPQASVPSFGSSNSGAESLNKGLSSLNSKNKEEPNGQGENVNKKQSSPTMTPQGALAGTNGTVGVSQRSGAGSGIRNTGGMPSQGALPMSDQQQMELMKQHSDFNYIPASHGGNVGSALKQGGHVPGKAKVEGNSYKNDTVKALLSPGEVVIPRDVMNLKDPVRGAAQFVQAVMAKKGRK